MTDDYLQILVGDCRDKLDELADQSVHLVVTSPPYFGLRDYGTATWEDGDPACDHLEPQGGPNRKQLTNVGAVKLQYKEVCKKCSARRIDKQIGLEPCPEEYCAEMVNVFRKLRRVLRDDGSIWLNLGDSYAGSGKGGSNYPESASDKQKSNRGSVTAPLKPFRPGAGRADGQVDERAQRNRDGVACPSGVKPKDLIGIPWMVAFALRADGWYLRSDVIWHKPNPMPESVTDRPTRSHEYLFLLTKSSRYYYDYTAISEPIEWISRAHSKNNKAARKEGEEQAKGLSAETQEKYYEKVRDGSVTTRNKRSVWKVATISYKGAHFATFPPKLIEPCILAGSSFKCCAQCGAPWERVTEKERSHDHKTISDLPVPQLSSPSDIRDGIQVTTTTVGFQPTCECNAGTKPCTVLDPFGGSGTTARVANEHGRRAIIIDLNPDYSALSEKRTSNITLGLGI